MRTFQFYDQIPVRLAEHDGEIVGTMANDPVRQRAGDEIVLAVVGTQLRRLPYNRAVYQLPGREPTLRFRGPDLPP